MIFVKLQILGLRLGVDFIFAWDNDNNENHNHNNPRLNFVKGTVLGDKEQGVGRRDKEQRVRPKWRPSLVFLFCQPRQQGRGEITPVPLEGLVEDAINSDPDVLYNLAMVDHVTSVLRADTPPNRNYHCA